MFVVSTTERAKRVAKDLKNEFDLLNIGLRWSDALEAVAQMYEYKGWTDLARLPAGRKTSQDDGDSSTEEVSRRRAVHTSVLRRLGLSAEQAEAVLDKIRPTSRNKPAAKKAQLPHKLQTVLDMARTAISNSQWGRANDLATYGVQEAGGSDKQPFVDLLRELAPRSGQGTFNLGMAFLIGDTGKKDVAKATELFLSCIEMEMEDPYMATALTALGDIASGSHGGVADVKSAKERYLAAALSFGSAVGAFNAGIIYEREGDLEQAADLYRLGASGGHPHAMTNLATIILSGRVRGSGAELEQLYREAARLGDRVAIDALQNIGPLKREVDKAQTHMAVLNAIAPDLVNRMPTYDIEPGLWLDILQRHGWRIARPNASAAGEGAQIGVAVSSAGLRVPVVMSSAAYMRDDVGDLIMQKLRQQQAGKDNVVLIFSRSATVMLGRPPKAAICPGSIKLDGKWTDFFLREGGLDEAMRQHHMLLNNPALDPVDEFWTPTAANTASLADANSVFPAAPPTRRPRSRTA